MAAPGYFAPFDPSEFMREKLREAKAVVISTTTCPYCTLAVDQFKKIDQEKSVLRTPHLTTLDQEKCGKWDFTSDR